MVIKKCYFVLIVRGESGVKCVIVKTGKGMFLNGV